MNRATFQLTLSVLGVLALATGAWAAQGVDTEPQKCGKFVVIGQADDDAEVTVHGNVMILDGDEDEDAHTYIIKDGDGDEHVVTLSMTGGAGLAAGHLPGTVWLTAGTGAGDSDRGWLGIGLGEVQPALAAQLGLEGDHVMITNVVAGSPAEKAGLEQYDVITAIDGEEVGGSVGAFAEAIGQAGPDAKVKLTILRSGKEQTVQATLGSRPEGGAEWKYDVGFGPSISEKFRTRGKVLRVGPDGQVVLDDLGDLKNLEDLPQAVLDLLPDIDDIQTHLWMDADAGDVTTHIKTRVDRDGQIIELEVEGGDNITVRRTTVDADGNKETVEKVYDSAEELEAADEEAFEIYAGIQGGHLIRLHLNDMPGVGTFDWHFDLDDLDVDVDADQFKVDVHQAYEDAMKAYEEAMKNLDASKFGKLRQFATLNEMPFGPHWGKAKHKFSVDSDGHIEIRIRKGDSEVVLNYDSEEDLRKGNPEMYEKYMDVMQAPVEQ